MADDDNWLKKNPHSRRMSLKRALFYPREVDMNASLTANFGKERIPAPQLLRPTNLTAEDLQTVFKWPQPVPAKTQPKKQNNSQFRQSMRMTMKPQTRDSVANTSRIPSMASKVQVIKRPTMLGPRRTTFLPSTSVTRPNIVQLMKEISESAHEQSTFEEQKTQIQSTPIVTTVPRSILKNSSEHAKNRNQGSNSGKPKAARKVNFDGLFRPDPQNVKPKVYPNAKSKLADIHSEFGALDESTIVFTKSFKPVTYEESKLPSTIELPEELSPVRFNANVQEGYVQEIEVDGKTEVEKENEKEKVMDEQENKTTEIEPENLPEKQNEVAMEEEKENVLVPGLASCWNSYQNKLEDIYDEGKLLDESFLKILGTTSDKQQLQNEFISYKKKMESLHQRKKGVEEIWTENMKSQTCVKLKLATYVHKLGLLHDEMNSYYSELKTQDKDFRPF